LRWINLLRYIKWPNSSASTPGKITNNTTAMTISLAFLAPNLVQAAVEGRLPRGVGIANLRDAPAEWSLQYARLGLTP
jgi:hypothetical protein